MIPFDKLFGATTEKASESLANVLGKIDPMAAEGLHFLESLAPGFTRFVVVGGVLLIIGGVAHMLLKNEALQRHFAMHPKSGKRMRFVILAGGIVAAMLFIV